MSKAQSDSEQFLQPKQMIRLYGMGAFPMARPDQPDIVEWFLPDIRTIIPIKTYNIPRSLRKYMEQWDYEVVFDRDFNTVVRHCAERETTWISEKLIEAYNRLLQMGHIHTVEIYHKGELAGGLYGVTYGGAFFGESMFSLMPQGSKIALIHLLRHLSEKGFMLLDVQLMTEHLRMFGAVEISSAEYNSLLEYAILLRCQF